MTGEPLRIGVAGLGTVGAGVIELLETHAAEIAERAGRPVAVTAVSARDRRRNRGVAVDGFKWFDDAAELAECPEIDVFVELIGGEDGIAKASVERALAAGKHVVTANKALIAHHGTELARKAEAAGLSLMFEAAVAGGIPVLKALREGLAANAVSRVYGILNGTCNYILSEMQDTGRPFADVLDEAQAEGYAEADPSFDVDGIDAAHKLAILAGLVFGTALDFEGVHVEGIREIAPEDISYADELGYGIKLLGIASLGNGGVEQRVHPCMVPKDAPVNRVGGVFNAVVAEGDFVGRVQFEGRGAGAGPTASAVVADLIDIARGLQCFCFSRPATALKVLPALSMDAHRGAYYMRFEVLDKPGVFKDVAEVLSRHQVSMEAIIQRQREPGAAVPVVMTTHEVLEKDMMRAVSEIGALDAVVAKPCVIRVETL